MLILERKAGKAAYLVEPGDGPIEERVIAKVQIAGVEHNRVKLGIEADPDQVEILREELPEAGGLD